ncbi:MAG: LL-diaminopimelate aminotransferase, partial [Clostridia bacterium]|nr:LL-diaminopimelate aminotransferase [Clostridia bacterium]
MRINDEYGKLPGSYLFAEIARRLKLYQKQHPDADIIKLGIGDVTQPLVPAVIEAMHAAVDEMGKKETFRGYGPDYGYDFLVNAIREHDYAPYGVELDYDEVFISDGAKCDVGNIQELFSADAVIAITDPVYPGYVDSNAMAGRAGEYIDGKWNRLVYLPCNAENGFVPELPKEHVDVLYLCYPNNPTGTVLTKAQLKVFVDWAKANDTLIIYDSAYKAFITEPGIPHSIYEVEGALDVAIECCSYSKTAGFTGTRCAYMIVPHRVKGLNGNGESVELNAMWKRRMSTKFNGVSYPVQRAAAAIYTPEGKAQVEAVIKGYLQNARVIHDGL